MESSWSNLESSWSHYQTLHALMIIQIMRPSWSQEHEMFAEIMFLSWNLHALNNIQCSQDQTFDLECVEPSWSHHQTFHVLHDHWYHENPVILHHEPFMTSRAWLFHAHALFMLLTTINILKIMNISCSQQIFHAYVLRLLNIPCSWHHIHKSKLKAFLAPVSWSNWPEHWKYFLL